MLQINSESQKDKNVGDTEVMLVYSWIKFNNVPPIIFYFNLQTVINRQNM
jgi:hypothetical protein